MIKLMTGLQITKQALSNWQKVDTGISLTFNRVFEFRRSGRLSRYWSRIQRRKLTRLPEFVPELNMYKAQSAQEGMAIQQTLPRCQFYIVQNARGNPKIRFGDYTIFPDKYHQGMDIIRANRAGETGRKTLQFILNYDDRSIIYLEREGFKKIWVNFGESEANFILTLPRFWRVNLILIHSIQIGNLGYKLKFKIHILR